MGSFNSVRDAVESAASLGGNYLLPGSSLVSDQLVSKGSQKQLGSTLGQIAQVATGLTGSGVGSDFTGIPSAASVGAGWTNAANGVGNLVSPGSNVGTSISSKLGSLLGSSGAASAAGTTPTSFPAMPGSAIGAAGGAPIPTLENASSAIAGTPNLASALSVGSGGGGSSYGTLGALLGAGTSLYSNDQAQKQLLAAQQGATNAIAPYTATGAAANSSLSNLLGTSKNTGAAGYGSLLTPFTPGDLTQTPGYQFNLSQGNQALDRQAAAKGNYFSGGALKDAETFGQGLADNTYNNAYNQYTQNQNNTYSKLAGQAASGQGAATTLGSLLGSTGAAQANSTVATGNTINSTLASLLSGSGAKKRVNIGGQDVYI